MAHQSVDVRRLKIHAIDVPSFSELPAPKSDTPEAWLFVLPAGDSIENHADCDGFEQWFKSLMRFAAKLNSESVVAIFTTPCTAAETWLRVRSLLQFQLWIAVKLETASCAGSHQLPEHHAALLVLSRYRSALRHTKTRIAYSYCPACDKTTKDYGGKKHTYHEYGTLLSDVWRDISFSPERGPKDIVCRVADLFGLQPYTDLFVATVHSSHLVHDHRDNLQDGRELVFWAQERPCSKLINGDSLLQLQNLPSESRKTLRFMGRLNRFR